jgi:hypothetical protein
MTATPTVERLRVTDPYDPRANAETFDVWGYLAQFDPQLLATKEGRRTLTRTDPLLFALVYLRHHLRSKETSDELTFSDMHLDLYREGRAWMRPVRQPREFRDAYVASRGSAKTTMLFLILPMWAAAHKHLKFVAAFADSATQAQVHLETFKNELDTNNLLRYDWPSLATPTSRPRNAPKTIERAEMLHTRSGFTFVARGIDASSLGMKVGERRPDLLLLDDIERDEASYSAYQAGQRLTTLVDAVLPLNEYARVVLIGTTTMPGSIVHQLVRHNNGEGSEDWITDEQFSVHHYRPIIVEPDGRERSIWPGKWPIEYLLEHRHTRSFAKNFDCDPMAADGDYWTRDDIEYGSLPAITRTCLWVDPAVTSKPKRAKGKLPDRTGLAVVSWQPALPEAKDPKGQCEVRYAEGVRLSPDALRTKVLTILEIFPETRVIIVEANQGGDTWLSIFHDMPPGVKVITVHSTEPKEVRFARALNHYQRDRVKHTKRFFDAEVEMIGFPKLPHDDVADAVVGGVLHHLNKPPRKVAGAREVDYV